MQLLNCIYIEKNLFIKNLFRELLIVKLSCLYITVNITINNIIY